MKIAIATGTRADWGLLQPLADQLRKEGVAVEVMALHQHLIPEMGNTVDEIRHAGFEPRYLIPAAGSPTEIAAAALAGAGSALEESAPDAIVILGDRCEMLGVASAALFSGIPIVHIAGGTVSEGAFDDSVRHAISKMASLHFPETELSRSRLIQMGETPGDVITAGALGVENAMRVNKMTRKELAESLDGWDPGENFLVVTLHAATLEERSPLDIQEEMLNALSRLPADYKFLITYPNSDTDPRPLIESLRRFERDMKGRVKVEASLGRVRYLSAVSLSRGVVGNSSSGLVEVPSLGVPTLDIGCRQNGRECGESVVRCDVDEVSIVKGLKTILSEERQLQARKRRNPYGGEGTAKLMTAEIMKREWKRYPTKRFCRF